MEFLYFLWDFTLYFLRGFILAFPIILGFVLLYDGLCRVLGGSCF